MSVGVQPHHLEKRPTRICRIVGGPFTPYTTLATRCDGKQDIAALLKLAKETSTCCTAFCVSGGKGQIPIANQWTFVKNVPMLFEAAYQPTYSRILERRKQAQLVGVSHSSVEIYIVV